jgi:hypothetical protein
MTPEQIKRQLVRHNGKLERLYIWFRIHLEKHEKKIEELETKLREMENDAKDISV